MEEDAGRGRLPLVREAVTLEAPANVDAQEPTHDQQYDRQVQDAHVERVTLHSSSDARLFHCEAGCQPTSKHNPPVCIPLLPLL
jgi:hypothetical protein